MAGNSYKQIWKVDSKESIDSIIQITRHDYISALAYASKMPMIKASGVQVLEPVREFSSGLYEFHINPRSKDISALIEFVDEKEVYIKITSNQKYFLKKAAESLKLPYKL